MCALLNIHILVPQNITSTTFLLINDLRMPKLIYPKLLCQKWVLQTLSELVGVPVGVKGVFSVEIKKYFSIFLFLIALNRGDAKDTDIELICDTMVDALFSYLVTTGK